MSEEQSIEKGTMNSAWGSEGKFHSHRCSFDQRRLKNGMGMGVCMCM